MELKRIQDNAEFKAVGEPLKNRRTEIGENERRLELIRAELSDLRTNPDDGSTAWQSYLQSEPTIMAKRQKLKDEAARIEARQSALHQALSEGELAVGAVRGRLSREPCQQARPAIAVEAKKIDTALGQIAEANRRLSAIRAEIEAAGYLTGRLPSAQFDLGGRDEAYRRYILENFPETAKSK